ncbi:MAG: 6-phosphogluconolactonase [Roseiflexaceae bacterium]
MSEIERGSLEVYDTPGALAEAAARHMARLAREAVAARGVFSAALSGGSTPHAMFSLLAQEPLRSTIDWEKLHIFWSDERYVAPDDPESSYRMARETLLQHVHIPAANVYLVPTVGSTPEGAAEAYAATIAAMLPGDPPRFDLILLGMGPDGHTASLFPGAPAVAQPPNELVVPVYNSPKPPPTRVTFTYRLINAAANVLFLVAGADKAATLRDVLRGPHDPPRLPAQGVQPSNGTLTWLADRAAAELLAQ